MFTALAIIVLAVTIILFVPFLLLFSIKHVFKPAITYTLEEWLSALILMVFIGAAAAL